jgi:hypothetical protein
MTTYGPRRPEVSSDDVIEMFPFKKKRADVVPPQQQVSKDIPGYRMDGHAVEYRGEKGETRHGPANDSAVASDPHIEGFQPLPRCSHCGTAISYNQRKCHACEKESRRI